MQDSTWGCSYCGATNPPEAKACTRCGVRGVPKFNPRSKSRAIFGFIVIALFLIVLAASFI